MKTAKITIITICSILLNSCMTTQEPPDLKSPCVVYDDVKINDPISASQIVTPCARRAVNFYVL